MKFSVLLSLYIKESPTYLRQSLDSVFHQTLLPDEVVLVEDGPITSELEKVVADFVKHHPEMKVITLSQNIGLGKALNEGLKHCTYEVIARMDTDDISHKDRFLKQTEFLSKHPEISVVSGWIEEFENDISNIKSIRKLPKTSEELYEYGKSRCPINHPCVMYKKSDVQKVGGYHDFPEDYYLWGHMLCAGYKLYNMQESLLYFRSSPDVFKRRGGWKYACAELKMQLDFYKVGYINYFQLFKNIIIRFTIRVMPNSVRTTIYKKLLRS